MSSAQRNPQAQASASTKSFELIEPGRRRLNLMINVAKLFLAQQRAPARIVGPHLAPP